MLKHCISFLLRTCSVPHPIAKLYFQVRALSTYKPTLLGKPSHHAYQDSRIIFYQATHNHHIHLRTRDGNKYQETEWPPNKDYSRYQHIVSQSFQTKIPRREHKNAIIDTTWYLYIAQTQGKSLRIAFIIMIYVLKEESNKSLKAI